MALTSDHLADCLAYRFDGKPVINCCPCFYSTVIELDEEMNKHLPGYRLLHIDESDGLFVYCWEYGDDPLLVKLRDISQLHRPVKYSHLLATKRGQRMNAQFESRALACQYLVDRVSQTILALNHSCIEG